MDITQYHKQFKTAAFKQGYSEHDITQCLDYADNLYDNGLPIIYDQEHFSYLVGYEYPYILGISNDSKNYYKTFEIPKRNGGIRQIEEPYPSLKEIQSWILVYILYPAAKKFVSNVSKAFIPGRSIKDCAKFHKNKKIVIALDIHDFFGSTHYGAVYHTFKAMGYNTSVCTLLTKLCINHNSLPQGAPTSPMLSNLVFNVLDKSIFNYCKKRKILYTRYADDMVFSSNDIDIKHLISYVKMKIEHKGYRLNEEKTKIMSQGMRQNVTGIVVNNKLQVSRQYRKKIRQEMYYAHKFGIDEHLHKLKDIPSWITNSSIYIKHLLGKVNHVLQINPKDQEFQAYRVWLIDKLQL